MGRQHRIVSYAAVCVLTGSAAVSCSNDADRRVAEARRGMLRAQDLEAQQSARIAAQRITDERGNLLPSDTDVVGLVLPRGFNLAFTADREWYYDGEHPVGKVETYFDERLEAGSTDHPYPSAKLYRAARMKTNPKMEAVYVKIYPMPGRTDWTRVLIMASRPPLEHMPTPAEVQAHYANQRENYN
jgi:hypothetical protein